jgi:sugar lactone lactonase YvrE
MNGMCGAWGMDAVFSPSMLTLDGAGNLYVGSDSIDKITSSGALTQLVMLNHPLSGLTVAPTGLLFYAQSTPSTSIDEVRGSASSLIFDLAPSCNDTGSDAGDPGLGEPAGIAADPEGNLYVADEACFRVREFSLDGGIITTLAGTGDQGDKDGPGSMATFSQLGAIAIDPNGDIYVAESDTARIREIQPDGTTRRRRQRLFLELPDQHHP